MASTPTWASKTRLSPCISAGQARDDTVAVLLHLSATAILAHPVRRGAHSPFSPHQPVKNHGGRPRCCRAIVQISPGTHGTCALTVVLPSRCHFEATASPTLP